MKNKKFVSTCFGLIALLFWSFGALCAVELAHLPHFEYLFLILFGAFLFGGVRITYLGKWGEVMQYRRECLLGGAIIGLTEFFYLSAFRYAPAAQVDLINYLWPIMLLAVTPFVMREKVSSTHILSAIIGFSAVFLLLFFGDGGRVAVQYGYGYGLAFAGALCWVAYNLFARKNRKLPIEMIGIYCGLAALPFFFLHLVHETFVFPSSQDLLYLLLAGCFVTGAAFLFWDRGFKAGHHRFLTVASHFTPVTSVGILVLFGKAEASLILAIASCMLVIACLLDVLFQQSRRVWKQWVLQRNP